MVLTRCVKQRLLRLIFMAEIVVVVTLYFFGHRGWHNVWLLKQENRALERRIHFLKRKNELLKTALSEWNEHLFYKEKVAREELQMACTGEEVYYLI